MKYFARRFHLCLIFLGLFFPKFTLASEKTTIDWRPWSNAVFAEAKKSHKLVLLDLGAGWCHWCHVMDEMTYADPAVADLLRDKYVAVRVDQDERPDLSNRYEDYGWPATIIFKADGTELAKRRGYIPPKPMASMLQAFIDDPTPGPSIEAEPDLSVKGDSVFTGEQRIKMREAFQAGYDAKAGGWGRALKYLDWNALEYCLTDQPAPTLRTMARQTLTAGLKLVDPVWGGVDQYSTDGDWDHPHFEKIMPYQAESLRIYSLAAFALHDPAQLGTAEKIHGYLHDFLMSPEGAFYTSQDADVVPGEHSAVYFALDDARRRKIGVPRIDRHIYARENGLAITGLCALYSAIGNPAAIAEARHAAEWIIAHRALSGGGFRHDETDAAGPYLADTLSMGRAFLSLYTVTAELRWLTLAENAAVFINAHFYGTNGYLTAMAAPGSPFPPKPEVDENITLVRFARLLYAYTGATEYQNMAAAGMTFLASPAVADHQGYGTSGLLLADREFRTDPTHVTVVGPKEDPVAQRLFAASLRCAPPMSRIEWLDERQGQLPRQDVAYPTFGYAVAFLCTGNSCSAPIKTPEKLEAKFAYLPRPSEAPSPTH